MPPPSPGRTSAQPRYTRRSVEQGRAKEMGRALVDGGLFGVAGKAKPREARAWRLPTPETVALQRPAARGARGGAGRPERPHSVAGHEHMGAGGDSDLPQLGGGASKTRKARSKANAGQGVGGGAGARLQPRDLSPLRDPRAMAAMAASSVNASALSQTAQASASAAISARADSLIAEHVENSYASMVRESYQQPPPDGRGYTPVSSIIPDEFRQHEVAPIFVPEGADNHDMSYSESKGGFETTVFPSKKPVRRSEVAKLRDTLEKMLRRVAQEDRAKLAKLSRLGVEEDALLAMLGDSEADVKQRVERSVRKKAQEKINVVERMREEEQAFLMVCDELSRQVAVQSKDRAALLLQLVGGVSAMFRKAVDLTTGDIQLYQEQNRRMAEQDEQMAQLRRRNDELLATVADRDASIEELDETVRQQEKVIAKTKAKLKKVEEARDKALQEVTRLRDVEQDWKDQQRENKELRLEMVKLKGKVSNLELDVKQARKEKDMETAIVVERTEELKQAKDDLARMALASQAAAASGVVTPHAETASKDDGSMLLPTVAPAPLKPLNKAEQKVKEQKRAQLDAEMAQLEQRMAAQVTKVVKTMEEDAGHTIDLDDVADGTHSAAQAAISTSIRHIDRSTIVATQEQEVDAELDVTNDVAEHMASLQLKRLKKHVDEVERRAKRLAHRVQEAEAEEKRHKNALESGRLVTQDALAHAIHRIAQLEGERAHWAVTEKRLTRDREMTEKDIRRVEKGLRGNGELEHVLSLVLPERLERVGENVGALDADLEQLAAQQAEGRARLQYSEQLDANAEAELLRQLAALKAREENVEREKADLLQDKAVIEKELEDIAVAMKHAQQQAEEEADVLAAEMEVEKAQQTGDAVRLVAAQQRLAQEQAEFARVKASLAGEQTLLVAIDDKDKQIDSITRELEASREAAAALREQLKSGATSDGRPLSREQQVNVQCELQETDRQQKMLAESHREASQAKQSMSEQLQEVKQITAAVANATPAYQSDQRAQTGQDKMGGSTTISVNSISSADVAVLDSEQRLALESEIASLRSRVSELETEITRLTRAATEDSGSGQSSDGEAVRALSAQNKRLSEDLQAAQYQIKSSQMTLNRGQAEVAATRMVAPPAQNQAIRDLSYQDNNTLLLRQAQEEIVHLKQLLSEQEQIALSAQEIADAASSRTVTQYHSDNRSPDSAADSTFEAPGTKTRPDANSEGKSVTDTTNSRTAARSTGAGATVPARINNTGTDAELSVARMETEAVQNELKAAQAQLVASEKALEKKRVQYEKLQAKVAANDEVLAAQAELEILEKKVRKYKDLLSASEQEALLAQERQMRYARELKLTTVKLEDALEAVRKSQAETAGYRSKLGELQQEHNSTLEQLAAAQAELEALRSLKGMKERCEELELEVRRLHGLLSMQEAEIARLCNELDDVKRKLASALSELCRPVAEVAEVGAQAEESAEEVVDSLLSEMLTSAVELGLASAQWQARLDAEVELRLAAEAERDEIAERARTALEEVEKAQKQAQKLREQLGTALGQVEQLTKRVEVLESELASAEEERDALRAQMEELTAQIASLEGQLETEKAKTKSLVQELNMLKITHEGLKKQLQAATAEIEVLTQTIEEMRAELRRNGVVDKWKQAALAAQLERARGMIPVRPESRENDAQTDPPPPPKPPNAVAAVLPELAVSVVAGTTAERTIRIVNYGEGPLQLSGGVFRAVGSSQAAEQKPAWINWADSTFNGELELEGIPSVITSDSEEEAVDTTRTNATTCILPEAPIGSISVTLLSAEVGTHEAQMVFSTNDPRQPVVAVPVTFTVLPLPPTRPSSRDGGMQTDALPEPEPVIVTKEVAVENTDEIDRLRAELAALREAYAALQREVDTLRSENSSLKDALAARDAELARLREQMSELEAALKRAAEAGGDNDFYERMEWERNIREQLKGMVVDTCDHGVQTDSDEHRVEALEQRDAAHGAAAGRELHKPRFLAPLLDDATLAARPLKPLRWLLKVIESLYEAKFVADAVDNRYGHPHDPLPEFIYMWTVKRYGLRDLVGATRWDIANAVNYYGDEHSEARLFGAFMHEEYGTEQLGFFLYCRS